jgi:hypothetical protein
MAASEDEEVQKRGMVGVIIAIGNKQPFNLKDARSVTDMARSVPNYWPSTHFCVENRAMANALALWMGLMRKQERVRHRRHVGKSKRWGSTLIKTSYRP